MTTRSEGYRLTPKRAAELEQQIAEARGATDARLELLEKRLAQLEQKALIGFELARGRVAAELTVLRAHEGATQ